ncbi:L-rhamnose-binding lectin CSL3-like [Corticium candelabrum]|uniref:L-rhamnose-binding lectin CSL3-like n=1 Tax=Corticium candelabrum TaxID=121492 RepID=UPI002E27071F|nr:L-rhamnose-binding lectin CSL3-like [Corticium candelabrum]
MVCCYAVTGKSYWKTTCERRTATIDCNTRYIFIDQATYGRENRWTCPSSRVRKTGCRSHISLQEVRVACQGYHHCSIAASNSVFGDPCHGTSKYLKFRYYCYSSPVMYITRRACERQTLRQVMCVCLCVCACKIINSFQLMTVLCFSLSCPIGYKITISEALYGRTSHHPCAHKNRRNVNCRAVDSYSIVQSMCQGRRTCNVRASNSVFGDPCRGTHKYLQVKYVCFK